MATISGIRYDLTVQGNSYITDKNYYSQFIPTSKVELLFDNITTLNGEILLPLTGIDTLKTVMIESDDATLRLYNVSGLINRYDVNGIMLCELHSRANSGIVSGSVSTGNTTGISASVTLIGYV